MRLGSRLRWLKIRVRRWLRTYASGIFTVLTLGSGFYLLSYYFLAPESQIAAPGQGFGCAASIRIRLDYVNLVLLEEEEPPQLWLYGRLKFEDQRPTGPGPYYLMFVLPFHVLGRIESSSVFPSYWNYTLLEGGASVSYATYTNSSLARGDFNIGFYISRTYMAAYRGITTIFLPLETLVGGETVGDLQSKLKVSLFDPPQMTVYITLPLSADNVQAFPETSSRTPYVREGSAMNSIKWNLTGRKSISLSYIDRDAASFYEFVLLLGGLLLGTGVSGVHNWLNRLAANKRRK